MGKKNKTKKAAAQADLQTSDPEPNQPVEDVEQANEEVKHEDLIELGPPVEQQSEPTQSPEKGMFDDIDDLLDNSILSMGSSIKN